MLLRFVVPLVVKLLARRRLDVRERNLLTSAVLDRIGALPLRDIISVNEQGFLLVNGVLLEPTQAQVLREEAKKALANKANKLVWDQVRYSAFVGGVSQGASPEDILFYRTAIWNGEQVRNYLRVLAGDVVDTGNSPL